MTEEDKKKNQGRPLPPVETRWKPGVSGNPRGRPKKNHSLTSLMKEALKQRCPADKEGRTWMELIVRAIIQNALKGNSALLRELWNRTEVVSAPEPEQQRPLKIIFQTPRPAWAAPWVPPENDDK